MTAIQPMGNNPLIPYNQMGQDPTDQKPNEEQNFAVAGILDRFKVVKLQNEVDEKGAKHVEETIQDYFKEMNSTIAALVEENRLLKKERATAETNLQLAYETYLNAMNQLKETNEQQAKRLDETHITLSDVQNELQATKKDFEEKLSALEGRYKDHVHGYLIYNGARNIDWTSSGPNK